MTIRGFVVATKCKTSQDFVEKYYQRTDDTSIFVGIVEERVLGAECAFALLLADRKPVFAGICTVLEVFRDANNPYQRRGMRLGIRKLGVTSEAVFAQMAEARAASRRRRARGSSPPVDDDETQIDLDEIGDSIPVDLGPDLTSPTVVRG
jgi:hypothetical protein